MLQTSQQSDARVTHGLWSQVREVASGITAVWAVFGIVLSIVSFISTRAPVSATYEFLRLPRTHLGNEVKLPSELLRIEIENRRSKPLEEFGIDIGGIARLDEYGFESNSRRALDAANKPSFIRFDKQKNRLVTEPIRLPGKSYFKLTVRGRFYLDLPSVVAVESSELGTLIANPSAQVRGLDIFLVNNKYWLLIAMLLVGFRLLAIGADRWRIRRHPPRDSMENE